MIVMLKYLDWLKLVFLGFCIALFLFILQMVFAPRGIGRFQRLHSAVKDMIYYIDTVTGAVYDIDGNCVSHPKSSG